MRERKTHERRRILAVMASTCFVAQVAAAETIDRTVDAAADGTVRVFNVAGSVKIEAHDAKQVRVTGTLGKKVERVDVESEGGDVDIEVVLPESSRGGGGEAELVVRVPKGADVEVETVSATVVVNGVRGSVEVDTVSGDVEARDLAGDTEIGTVSGRIDVADVQGSVEMESVSGAMTAKSTGASVEAQTTSGSIDIDAGDVRWVECTSVSGSIAFAGVPRKGDKDAEIRLENFSGAVEVLLPDGVDAEVEVETFSGNIDTDFGGKVERPKFGPGASLEERWGDGSARISISTFSGAVELRKRGK